jgi:hypothetical protein
MQAVGAFLIVLQVFDMSEFKRLIAEQLKRPSRCNPYSFTRLSTFSFSFGKQYSIEMDTPVWIFCISFAALDLLGDDAGYLFWLILHICSQQK